MPGQMVPPSFFTSKDNDLWHDADEYTKDIEDLNMLTTYGAWLCDAQDVKDGDLTYTVVCFRFLPTSRKSSNNDLRFTKNSMNVKWYVYSSDEQY